MAARKPSRSELFLRNWPAIARVGGLVIGLAETASGLLGGPVSAEALLFAGSLILAPQVAGAQEKRKDSE